MMEIIFMKIKYILSKKILYTNKRRKKDNKEDYFIYTEG